LAAEEEELKMALRENSELSNQKTLLQQKLAHLKKEADIVDNELIKESKRT